MRDIPGYESFTIMEIITKGLSGNEKYRIKTADGEQLLLRIGDITEYERTKTEYDMLKIASALDIQMSRPVDFGVCDNGKNVYQLLTWVEGVDAESLLPSLTEAEQFALGIKSGELLKKIHGIPAPEGTEDWAARHHRKLQRWLDEYSSKAAAHSATGDMLVDYLNKNRALLAACPQTFIHGDFNTENIICLPNGEVGAIDFNSFNTPYGDPWFDINAVAWTPTMFPAFYSGQIRGYFGGNPPPKFWKVFYYYLAYDALAALLDPENFGVSDGKYVVDNVLTWTNSFKNSMPTWFAAL